MTIKYLCKNLEGTYDLFDKLPDETLKYYKVLLESERLICPVMGINYLTQPVDFEVINCSDVIFVREPDNKFDSQAIMIMVGDTKIGYVPQVLTYLYGRFEQAYMFLSFDSTPHIDIELAPCDQNHE